MRSTHSAPNRMAALSNLMELPRRLLRLDPLDQARLAVLAAVLLSSLVLAMRASRYLQPTNMLRDPLILLYPAAVGLYALLRWPALGLVGLVAAGLAISFEVNTGTQTRLNALVLLLPVLFGLWLFRGVVKKRRIRLVSPQVTLPLLVFVAVALLSFLVGQLPWFVFAEKASLAAQVGGLALFILSAVAFLLVAGQVRDIRWLQWMVWAFLALGAFHIAGRIIPPLRPVADSFIQRGAISSSIFWIWMLSLSMSQALFNRDLHPAWRLALGGLVLGILYVSLGTDSGWTSGWLPSLAAAGVMLLVSRSRLAWLAILAGIGMAALKSGSVRNLVLAGNEYSLFTRLEAWRIIADIVRVNPILGLGPSNYYWYTPLYGILGYLVSFNSHNNYVDLIAQTGLLGLAVFLWFSAALGLLGLRLRQTAPPGFARAYVYGAVGALAGTLVAGMLGDWFIPFVYNIGFQGSRASLLGWAFLGGLVAIQQIYFRGQSEKLS